MNIYPVEISLININNINDTQNMEGIEYIDVDKENENYGSLISTYIH